MQITREFARRLAVGLYSAGAGTHTIAKQFCVSRRVIYNWLHDAAAPIRGRWLNGEVNKRSDLELRTKADYYRWNTYRVTPAEFQRLLSEQSNSCACCGASFEMFSRAPAIDHDHATGRVRGLLCCNCNSGIGKLGDGVDGLRRAIRYLESSR